MHWAAAIVDVQSLSHVQLFEIPWTAAHQASSSFTISQSLLKLTSIGLVIPSNHLILCHLLLLPSIFSSNVVFSNESALHIRWPKNWSFSNSTSNEYSGLISFRIDWFCCRKADPFQGLKLGSCLTHGNELSYLLTKQEILLGKGTQGESSRVREPRRTALPRGSQSRVLWQWD